MRAEIFLSACESSFCDVQKTFRLLHGTLHEEEVEMIRFCRAERIGRVSACVVHGPTEFFVDLPKGLVMQRIVFWKNSFPIILDITGCDLRFVENRINISSTLGLDSVGKRVMLSSFGR